MLADTSGEFTKVRAVALHCIMLAYCLVSSCVLQYCNCCQLVSCTCC